MNGIVEKGAIKASETIANRALNAVVDFAKKKYGEKQVEIGKEFDRYLNNAVQRYNKVRTLATGPNPRKIIGKDNIYIEIGVKHGDKVISTENIDELLKISNKLIIQGTGGIGKSMLMRYLFIDTATTGQYIPVLLELRKISNQPAGEISILELIYSCLMDFDVNLSREQFEYSLRLGKYLFLFDGFDEVKEALAAETAEKIQEFSSKYPKNPCVITSRPKQETSPLETFTTVSSLTLSKAQATSLASKLWPNDEKAKEFCKQLDSELFEKHKDFAENPLLLSMMFLTFMRNNSIPDHLSDFYNKAYEALYSAHDNNDKGTYKRDFVCSSLDEAQFKLLLSRFCFVTYFKEIYEFKTNEIMNLLKECIDRLQLKNISANDYLKDLRNAVCIIVQDGEIYRFSHRSFQAYFAAVYTASVLTDEEQKSLFNKVLSKEICWHKRDYYNLLSQIEHERFAVNALEDTLKQIQNETDKAENPNLYFLKLTTNAIDVYYKDEKSKPQIGFYINEKTDCQIVNVIDLFHYYITKRKVHKSKDKEYFLNLNVIQECIEKLPKIKAHKSHVLDPCLHYSEIERYFKEKQDVIYSSINYFYNTEFLRSEVRNFLIELDERRQKLNEKDFIDEL